MCPTINGLRYRRSCSLPPNPHPVEVFRGSHNSLQILNPSMMTSAFRWNTDRSLDRRLSIAPMMARTDRHYRYFMRQLTGQTLLYTEMVVADAVVHGDRDRLLSFDREEHPLGLQLGGSDPAVLARAARIAADYGYDEINLNVGCPSNRVRSGGFGACLMATPQRVGDCVANMIAAVPIPITVKCRIGIDQIDSYQPLAGFIDTVAAAGCQSFMVHARKAWLQGLNPKQNRTLPPLRYDRVYALKQDFPRLEIVINGGIQTLDQVLAQQPYVDGVMIGRAAYRDPWILAAADRRIFGLQPSQRTRSQAFAAMLPYLYRNAAAGVPMQRMTRHLQGLFYRQPNARNWRLLLSSGAAGVDDACRLLRLSAGDDDADQAAQDMN